VTGVALATWKNIAVPSILFGGEAVNFSDTSIEEIDGMQRKVAKDILGLGMSAPNVVVQAILGLKCFKHLVYAAKLKFYVRVMKMSNERWSKDALLDHLSGVWRSPYVESIVAIKRELGIIQTPVSAKHVDLLLDDFFLTETNKRIVSLGLPALHLLSRLRLRDHVDESEESKVIEAWLLTFHCPAFPRFLVCLE
jgi:hypothetical protein